MFVTGGCFVTQRKDEPKLQSDSALERVGAAVSESSTASTSDAFEQLLVENQSSSLSV
jgi:hypothetical protein